MSTNNKLLIGHRYLLPVSAKPYAGEMRAPFPVSTVVVEHSRYCISIRHHKMWDPSPGVDARGASPLRL
jgi:hypothetical protein